VVWLIFAFIVLLHFSFFFFFFGKMILLFALCLCVQGANYVICPVLGSLIREGSLKLAQDGTISLSELRTLMITRLGITKERADVTIATGVIGNHFSITDLGRIATGRFSIPHLAGSFLDHQGRGDTGILKGKYLLCFECIFF
jgi:hypothetical protein